MSRVTGVMAGSWMLAGGEHVCWRAQSESEFAAGRTELVARAGRHAGGLLLIGGESGRRLVPRGSGAPHVTLPEARERILRARRGGRAPWVLASMRDLASTNTPAADVVALELELAELAAEADTAVVCAYHGGSWEPEVLGAVTAVHSRVVGISSSMSGFRLRTTGGGYALEGSVGFESLPAFTAALRGALIRSPDLSLCCRRLDLIDASAMRALVEIVTALPGCSVRLDHVGETVRRAWELSGYGADGIPVQVRP